MIDLHPVIEQIHPAQDDVGISEPRAIDHLLRLALHLAERPDSPPRQRAVAQLAAKIRHAYGAGAP